MKKVAVISLNALGDTYLSLSAFPLLRAGNNRVHITLFTSKNFAELATLSGADEIYYSEKNIISLVKSITSAKLKFDEIFNFFPGRVNSVLFNFLPGKKRFGFSNYSGINEWYSLTQATDSGKSIWKPEDNYLKRITLPLTEAGYKTEGIGKFVFPCLPKTENVNRTDIVLHLSSRSAERRLPNSLMNSIAEHFTGTDKVSYFNFGQDKQTLDSAAPVTPSLEETVKLLCGCKLFISNDSFPLHVAEAYSVPTVALFGPTRAEAVISDFSHIQAVNLNDPDFGPEKVFNAAEELLTRLEKG